MEKRGLSKKIMRRILFILLMLLMLFIIPIGIAQLETLGSFEQGEDARIAQVCYDATYINISSITYPNSSIAVSNIEMVSAGSGEFYYNFTETDDLGRYDVRGISDGCTNTFATYFIITPNGEQPTEAHAIFYIGLLFLIVFGFGVIIYIGVTKEGLVVKTFSIGFGYLFLIAIFFLSWNLAADFLTSSPFLISFFYYIFIALMIGFFPLLLILFGYGVYMALTIKEIKKMVESGIPESEAAERVRWKK